MKIEIGKYNSHRRALIGADIGGGLRLGIWNAA